MSASKFTESGLQRTDWIDGELPELVRERLNVVECDAYSCLAVKDDLGGECNYPSSSRWPQHGDKQYWQVEVHDAVC